MKYTLLAAVGLFCLTISTLFHTARAQDREHYPIGQLVALEGRVFYAANENHTEMKLNDPVFLNTVVETGPASRALILFVDNTQITLGENAQVTIDEYVFDPYDPEENKGTFELSKGAFMWVSGLVSKRAEPQVKIKNKMGSIGIRGTEFWSGELDAERYGVFTFDGLVNWSVEKGAIDIPKNTGVILGPDKPDLEATEWKTKTIEAARESVAFHNQADIDDLLKTKTKDNIAKQHDYRGRMFPYKENPLEPRVPKKKQGDFFTDEFEQMRDKQ